MAQCQHCGAAIADPSALQCRYCGAAVNVIDAKASERIAASVSESKAGIDELMNRVKQLAARGAFGEIRFSEGRLLNSKEFTLIAVCGAWSVFGKFMDERSKRYRIEFMVMEGENYSSVPESVLYEAWKGNAGFRWHGGFILCSKCARKRHMASFRRSEELMRLSENRFCAADEIEEMIEVNKRNLASVEGQLRAAQSQGDGFFGMNRGPRQAQILACQRQYTAVEHDLESLLRNRDLLLAHLEDQPSIDVASRMTEVVPSSITELGYGQCQTFGEAHLSLGRS